MLKNLIDKKYVTDLEIDEPTAMDAVNSTGCQTLTFEVEIVDDSSANATIVVQSSVSGENWFDEESPTAISASVNLQFAITNPGSKLYRLNLAGINSGSVALNAWVIGKGLDG